MPSKRAKEEDADVPDDAQDTICSICLGIFQDPIALVCGHSLCRSCAEQLARTGLVCPECRLSTPLPPGGVADLKTNVALRNIIARLHPSAAAAPRVIIVDPPPYRHCQDHQLERDMYCETCAVVICRGCLGGHRGHILEDLRHDAAGFMARVQPALAIAKQTMVASLVSRRAAFEEALRQQEAAAAAYESAMATTQKALTDYGAACVECDSFGRKAATVFGVIGILTADPPVLTVTKFVLTTVVVRSIGSGPGHGFNQFHNPFGIAVHPSGLIIVVDSGNHRLQFVKQDGTFLRSIGNGKSKEANQFDAPSSVAVLSSGNIVVSDRCNDRLQILRKDGTFVRSIGKRKGGEPEFCSPEGVAILPTGTIVVCDAKNHRLVVVKEDGTFIRTIDKGKGSAPNQFSFPLGIIVLPNGTIVVCDYENHRLQLVKEDGTFLRGEVMSGRRQTTPDDARRFWF